MARSGEYDAFISYSHALDGQLAPALRAGLERLAKPWRQRRALRVFQDVSGLGATPTLWSTIAAALDRSRFLIVLASPAAALSEWVGEEIRYFCRRGRATAVLLAVTAGECSWDTSRRDFNWAASTAVPPALRGVYIEEPLYVDLRWARSPDQLTLRNPVFRQAVGDLAAPLHGLPRDELDARDLVEHRRSRRARRAASAGLAVLTAMATVSAGIAVANAREARTQQLAAVDETGRVSLLGPDGQALHPPVDRQRPGCGRPG